MCPPGRQVGQPVSNGIRYLLLLRIFAPFGVSCVYQMVKKHGGEQSAAAS